jgi:hypothetical protein
VLVHKSRPGPLRYSFEIFSNNPVLDLPDTKGMRTIRPPGCSSARSFILIERLERVAATLHINVRLHPRQKVRGPLLRKNANATHAFQLADRKLFLRPPKSWAEG